jgi:hypothetical protein
MTDRNAHVNQNIPIDELYNFVFNDIPIKNPEKIAFTSSNAKPPLFPKSKQNNSSSLDEFTVRPIVTLPDVLPVTEPKDDLLGIDDFVPNATNEFSPFNLRQRTKSIDIFDIDSADNDMPMGLTYIGTEKINDRVIRLEKENENLRHEIQCLKNKLKSL